MSSPSGRLFLVATPIGNLGDLSPRARTVLASVDRVLAEDTRRTGQLLAKFEIDVPVASLHEHNEKARLAGIVDDLAGGATFALVSDAGTPAISDPGTLLVREARERGIAIETVPGPSALAAALAASGFPASPSLFLGFPPARSGERRRFLEPWAGIDATVVLYEAPHRIGVSLADLAELFGPDRPAILLREMTKLHEEAIDGTIGSIAETVAARETIKGEIVVVVAPPPRSRGRATQGCRIAALASAASLRARIAELLAEGLDRAEALRQAAHEVGLSRSEAYRRLFESSSDGADEGGEPPNGSAAE